jgi:anti-sigma factor RsiW
MKKDSPDNLREVKWRYTFGAAKEAEVTKHLAAHPDEEAEWMAEAELNRALDQLPEAPVASNFTAQVLKAVELEILKDSRSKREWPAWQVGFGWVSRFAMAGFIFAAGVFAFNRHQANQRTEMAHSVAQVSTAAALPAEWLKDFDTIRNLGRASAVDDELLAALR